jgi:c(7)-type cytochrome triheme protein
MRIKWFFVLITMAILVAFIIPWVKAQPDKIKLDHVVAFGKKQRPPVLFPHNQHIETGLSCKDCHHRYEKGKNVLEDSELEEGKPGIKCSECHGPKTRPKLREAFHRQCMDCHNKMKKTGKKTGPRLCGECHPWKN